MCALYATKPKGEGALNYQTTVSPTTKEPHRTGVNHSRKIRTLQTRHKLRTYGQWQEKRRNKHILREWRNTNTPSGHAIT